MPDSSPENANVTKTDLAGRIVWQEDVVGRKTLKTGGLSQGIYLRAAVNEWYEKQTCKLVKR